MTDERAHDAFALAARLERLRDKESAQASVMVAEFALAALAAGLRPQRLVARSYTGRAGLRTNITGWYLKRDHSVGVSVDGLYYLLHAPDGLRARLKGVILSPSPPPLEIGRGARDGESMPLAQSLAHRLAAGNDEL